MSYYDAKKIVLTVFPCFSEVAKVMLEFGKALEPEGPSLVASGVIGGEGYLYALYYQ